MLANVAFDTLEYMDELKKSGMKQSEAEAITKATAKAFTQMMETKELATKTDITQIESSLRKDIHDVKIELMKYTSDIMWKLIGILSAFQTILLGAFSLIHYMGR